jgi:hypothetical protein
MIPRGHLVYVLVREVGMPWDRVHDEAEQLEQC